MTDRELDAEVAEKVFGWKQDAPGSIWWHDGRRLREVPDFSTSIVAAWALVERFVDMGGNMTVCRYPKGASAQVWVPGVAFGFRPTRPIQADTAPEAICHAALAAMASS